MAKNRRDFIKVTGLLGAASLLPFGKVLAGTDDEKDTDSCTLIPTETEGPFPLDLSANTYYFRQDIKEDRTGTPFKLKLKIIGNQNCLPLENVRVNIWHCDKDGLYSGYYSAQNTGSTPATANMKWLRGYQITDANGEVEFTTIFPGWYSGRICHIHFQVYVSSAYAAISQLTFPIADKQAVYAANPTEYTNGADPMTLASDNVFSDGYQYQMATLTSDGNGGYESYLEVTVQGSGVTTGLGNIEKENAKNFSLGQNFPNPYIDETTIPINLLQPADLTIDLYDLQGRKVATIAKNNLSSGEHNITLNMQSLGLSTGNYAYQMTVKNSNGIFTDCKIMTAGR